MKHARTLKEIYHDALVQILLLGEAQIDASELEKAVMQDLISEFRRRNDNDPED